MLAESSGARHAALLLHAMAPVDRVWMLDALPPTEREDLQRLLAELGALGIERDPVLIADATAGPSDSAAASLPEFDIDVRQLVPMSDEAWLHALDAGRLQALIQCMRAEPAGLVAEWLRLADWPWREELLAALEPAQRRRIEAILAASTTASNTPPGMRAAMISTVAERLQGLAPVDAVLIAPWHRLKHSVGRIFQGVRPQWSAQR
jgi:hypothetical protein